MGRRTPTRYDPSPIWSVAKRMIQDPGVQDDSSRRPPQYNGGKGANGSNGGASENDPRKGGIGIPQVAGEGADAQRYSYL